jgi:hypothetical protein
MFAARIRLNPGATKLDVTSPAQLRVTGSVLPGGAQG